MNNMVEIRPGRLVSILVYENPRSLGTIFMFHGLGGRGIQWREQINALQADYTLIVPDMLGHAGSSQPIPGRNNPYEFMEFAQDQEAIFKIYAGQKNIIMGHSYGGALAAFLASNHVAEIQKLILIAPVTCQPKTQIPFIYQLPQFIFNLYRPWLEKKFKDAAYNSHTTKDLVASEELADKNNKMYVIKAMVSAMRYMPMLTVTPITIPTLIIYGETDKIISLVKTTAFYELLPERKFVVVKNAGHMVMLEQPEQTNAVIKEFLAGTITCDPA